MGPELTNPPPQAGSGTARRWPPSFVALAAITFLLWLGSSILIPVLPLYGTSLGLDHADVGLIVGAFFAGRMVCNLAGGYLADRSTPRRAAVVGCVISAAASGWAGVADSFGTLVVARILQGGGAGIFLTVAVSTVIAISPAGEIGRHVAIYQGIGLVGYSVGPVLGGLVAEVGGLRAPFFVYAVVAVGGALLASVALPGHAVGRAGEPAEPSRGLDSFARAAMARPFVIALGLAVLVFSVRSGILNNLVPLLAETELGMSEVLIGAALSLAAVCNVAVLGHAGRSLDRRRRPVILRSTAVVAVVTALLGLVTTPVLLFLACALLAGATAYASVAPTVLTADVMPGAFQGRAVGTLRVATDFGLLVGPVMAGALSDLVGLRNAFVVAGIAFLALATPTLLLPETAPQQGSRTEEAHA